MPKERGLSIVWIYILVIFVFVFFSGLLWFSGEKPQPSNEAKSESRLGGLRSEGFLRGLQQDEWERRRRRRKQWQGQ